MKDGSYSLAEESIRMRFCPIAFAGGASWSPLKETIFFGDFFFTEGGVLPLIGVLGALFTMIGHRKI